MWPHISVWIYEHAVIVRIFFFFSSNENHGLEQHVQTTLKQNNETANNKKFQ